MHHHRLKGTTLLLACLVSVFVLMVVGRATAADRKPNVLFIAVDDLRPELGCYGVAMARTPNIDKLASGGMIFTRAYCQQALCSPSRTSLLTGLRPDTTKIYDLEHHFRKANPDVVTLPEYFKNHGYHVQALSKIYHSSLDDPKSWSVPHWDPKAPVYHDPEILAEIKARDEKAQAEGKAKKTRVVERDPKTGTVLETKRQPWTKGRSWECADVEDNYFVDGKTAEQAIKVMREIKDKPFFLAVGFIRPHLPFVAPKKYFDLYSRDTFQLAGNPNPPEDVPPPAMHDSGELRGYTDIPDKGPIPEAKMKELLLAYHAAASYTDAQIGKVLDELDKLGLRDNTIVVLWGDHGWHLGEHGMWCKHSNFEVATRAPLIITAPGLNKNGAKTKSLAEFVDIYPTLCELAGLPVPKGVEGRSLAPVLKNPEASVKDAAYSQYPRKKLMGHSVRTDRYRYTEWAEEGKAPEGVELYDHEKDPDENVNLANKPEYKKTVEEMKKILNAVPRKG